MSRRSVLLICALAVFITGTFALSAFIRSAKAQIITATDVNPDPDVFEAYLTAEEHDVNIAGQTVHAMVYKDDPPSPFTSSGAGIPAPEIRVKVGDTVIIHFKNNLTTDSASIHWHGIELDNDSDGTAVTQDAVLPGQSYTYRFKTFRPGLFWYHSHMAPSSATFAGMYGSIIIENNIEASLKGSVLPTDADTHSLVLSDIEYDSNGKVGKQFNGTTTTINELIEMCHLDGQGEPGGNRGACNIVAGPTVLVNGQNPDAGAKTPKFTVPSGKRIRLQLFNTSIARHFRLKLLGSGDNKIYRIGGEGGLLDNVRLEGGTQGSWDSLVDRGELILGEGDRADVIVVPSGPEGSIVQLVGNKLPGQAQGPFNGDTGYPDNYPIAFFEINGTSNDPAIHEGDPILAGSAEDIENIKDAPVNPLVDPAPFGGTSDPVIRTTNVRPGGAKMLPSIDGYSSMLDTNVGNGDFPTIPRPPTARYAHVGDVLELSVRNETAAAHPFHMHGFSMQPVRILDNTSGDTLYNWDYDEFIDTIDVYGGQTLVYRLRIDDRPRLCDESSGPVLAPCTPGPTGGAVGRWVYHCHIFHHAGLGMMSEVTILPSPKISVTPPSIDFAPSCPNDSSQQMVTIKNTSDFDTPVTVSGINLTGDVNDFALTGAPATPFDIPAGGSVSFNAVFAPQTYFAAPGNATITVQSNASGSPPVVTLSGTAPPPVIEVNPRPLDFGTVCADDIAGHLKNVAVSNTGTHCPLSVTSITVTGSDFQVVGPTSFTVNAGASTNVAIKFTPTSEGPKNGTLTIQSNDPSHPSISFPVIGITPITSLTATNHLAFPPTVIRSVDSCSSQLPLVVQNTGVCNLTVTAVSIAGVNAGDYTINGLGGSLPIVIPPGGTLGGGALNVQFRPTAIKRWRQAQVNVTYVADTVTGAQAGFLVPLYGEGVTTGARVLVRYHGVPVPQVQALTLTRLALVPLPIDLGALLPLNTVVGPVPELSFQYHREYGAQSNPIRLLPGEYLLSATVLNDGKLLIKTQTFTIGGPCDFKPNIVVDF